MKVLVFGKDGQVGRALLAGAARFPGTLVGVGRAECDLADVHAIAATVERVHPDAIVNAAAYTAVDRAESEAEVCFAINAAAPAAMAKEAARRGIPLIHYSTDYVFDGARQGPYVEEDATGPLNVYGASKLRGEEAIAASGARFAVLRTSWVYGNDGSNFLNTIVRLGASRPELRVVDDQHGSPTSAPAIAQATLRILRGGAEFPSGVYHMTAGGDTTWAGFAAEIFVRLADGGGPQPRVMPIPTEAYPTPAKRPKNSVLSNAKFERTFGFGLPEWREQLGDVLRARATGATGATGNVSSGGENQFKQ
jgi:dTDP-4-dehydrorhamnose reductase